MSKRLRIGVIGHVEHITLGRVVAIPRPGEIAHLEDPVCFGGGGGGVAFYQLAASDAELHLFTALGDDEAGAFVEQQLAATTATIHAARRHEPHTRDVAMIDPSGERTIVVVGQPLHPRASDPLPWELLPELDAVYFTAQDPQLLIRARAARLLLATARRKQAIAASGVRLDAIVGSVSDAREAGIPDDYDPRPAVLVMTDGARGGSVYTDSSTDSFESPPVPARVGSYGAGDSFAGAFTYYFAAGCDPITAAARAAHHGAAVLSSINPLTAQLRLPAPG